MNFSFEHFYFNLCDYPYEVVKIMRGNFAIDTFNFHFDFANSFVQPYVKKNFSKIDLIDTKNSVETFHVTFGINLLGSLMHMIEVLKASVAENPKEEPLKKQTDASENDTASYQKQGSLATDRLSEMRNLDNSFRINSLLLNPRVDSGKESISYLKPMNSNAEGGQSAKNDEAPDPKFEAMEKFRFQFNMICGAVISDFQVMLLTSTSPYEKDHIKVLSIDFHKLTERKS